MASPPPQRILIPIDGSAGGLRAVALAASLATPLRAHLTLLYVLDPTHLDTIAHAAASLEGHTQEALSDIQDELPQRVLNEALALLKGHAVTTHIERGDPADVILTLGRDHDLIIVGRSNIPGRSVFRLGSVSRKVIELTQQHVLVAG